jgi:hypothetical protein
MKKQEEKAIRLEDFCLHLIRRNLRTTERETVLSATSNPALDETPCSGGPKLWTRKEYDHNSKDSYAYMTRLDTKSLRKVYTCDLTGKQCVARRLQVYPGGIPSGRYAYAEVSLFYQRLCPTFKEGFGKTK